MKSFVFPVHAPPQPQPIALKAAITFGVTIPGRRRARLKNGRVAGSLLCPQPTYGFSRGLRSTASPKAWFDHVPVPRPPVHGEGTAWRHSNEPVPSPSGDRP